MHHTPSTRPVRFQRPLSKRGGEMQPCSAGFEGHVFSVCSDPFQLSRLFPSAPRRFFYSQEITSRRVLFTRYMVENVQFNIQDDLTIHPFPRFILIRIKRRHRSTTGAAFLRAMCLSLLSRLAAKNQDNWRRMKNNTVHRGWRWVVGLNKILFSPASSTITSFTLSVQPIRLRLHLLKPIVFSSLLLSVVTQAHIFATCPSPPFTSGAHSSSHPSIRIHPFTTTAVRTPSERHPAPRTASSPFKIQTVSRWSPMPGIHVDKCLHTHFKSPLIEAVSHT